MTKTYKPYGSAIPRDRRCQDCHRRWACRLGFCRICARHRGQELHRLMVIDRERLRQQRAADAQLIRPDRALRPARFVTIRHTQYEVVWDGA
jgi:hypothetical protein